MVQRKCKIHKKEFGDVANSMKDFVICETNFLNSLSSRYFSNFSLINFKQDYCLNTSRLFY